MDREKLITVIVPQGRGRPLLEALHQRGELRAALSSARAPSTYSRGTGAFARTIRNSVEKDVLQVMVSEENAKQVFEFLLDLAQISESPGGFMYMGEIARATRFALEVVGRA